MPLYNYLDRPITALQQFHRWCYNRGRRYGVVGMKLKVAKALEKLIPRIERDSLNHVLDLVLNNTISSSFGTRQAYRDELRKLIVEFRDRRD